MKGWTNNSNIENNEGFNSGKEFKLVYRNDGLIELYRDDVLLKTSAQTFSGAQTITLWQGWDGNVQNFQHSKTASNPGTPRVNAANQVNSLTLSGSFESGDVVAASINQVEITYVVTADDLTINGNGTCRL